MVKLVWYAFSPEQIWQIMGSAGIGKWQESREGYREITHKKAIAYVRGQGSK